MTRSSYYHLLQFVNHCTKTRSISLGISIHTHLIKTGFLNHNPLPNSLLNYYSKCGLFQNALQLFDQMPNKDLISWATVLTALNHSDMPLSTLGRFFHGFRSDGLFPDHFVYASLVKACSSLGFVRIGKQVHCRFVSSCFGGDDVVKSSLVDMYAKCGMPDYARLVFDSIVEKNSICWTAMVYGYAKSGRKKEAVDLLKSMSEKNNLVSWTALISGMVQTGSCVEAFSLFNEMRREEVDDVDPFILSTVVGISANLAALELGKQVHCLVLSLGFERNLFVGNALVDMYAKCSDLVAAKTVFDGIVRRDVVSWTSIIVGMAQHGRANEAFSLYDGMVLAGLKPNEVTFMGLIYACSHAGLVEKGRKLFKSMVDDYSLTPSLHHYTCLLDLYGRSGCLDEAEDLLKSMPFKPDEAAWAALLSACKHHGNNKMAIRVANSLLSIKPEDPSTYILLSNTYAANSMWEHMAKVRKLMSLMEVRKKPGYSSIELGKENEVFHAGEPESHPMKDEIFGLLKEFDEQMRRRGYSPDINLVFHDMEDHEKERQLFWHSERLAVAYGLLKSVPGSVIRVVKNLRICGDCHTVLKYISSIAQREIIVRDATRFHHFKYGICSCCDFW